MVQWLAHSTYSTSNQGDAGSIPTHGITCLSFKMDQLVVRSRYSYTQMYDDVYPSDPTSL